MNFLQFFWGALFLLSIGLFIRDSFIFQAASLPTFALRAVLDMILVYFGARALRDAERSTFGFLKTLTIPLLLGADIFLGYTISLHQIVGIGFIAIALLVLYINHGIKKKGSRDAILSAVIAVATISLYKYNIENFNTVEAEQGLMLALLMVYSYFMAKHFTKENPMSFLKKPIFLLQSISGGVASVGFSFAYAFAPASIIATAQRSLTVLFSIISGEVYFHEKHFLIKLVSFVLVAFGIYLLI